MRRQGGLSMDTTSAAVATSRVAGLSLRANVSWAFVGNVVYAGCQWAMLVVLAHLGTTAMVGLFALGLSVTAPIFQLSNLNLRAVQATDVHREYLFGHYLGLRLVSTGVALLLLVVVTFLSGYGPNVAAVIFVVGLAKAFEAISDAIYGLLQQRERMDRIAKSMMLKGPASLAALAIAVYASG